MTLISRPGEVGAEAEVRAAAAERQVLVGRAADVETSGPRTRSASRLAAGVVDDDLVALPDRLAGDLGVAGRGAAEVVDRAHPSGGTPRWRGPQLVVVDVGDEVGLRVGLLEQRRMAWAMRLRVVSLPATHEHDEEHVELVLAEPVAVDLGLDERGHDVVAGVGPAVGGDRLAVRVDLGGGDLAVLLGRLEVRVLEADQRLLQSKIEVAVLARARRSSRRSPAAAARRRPPRRTRSRPGPRRSSTMAMRPLVDAGR